MNSFRDVGSKTSWLILCVCFLPTHYIIFRPSLKEFGIYCAAEMVAFWIAVLLVERPLFPRLFPEFKRFFPDFDVGAAADWNEERRISFYQDVVRFPQIRSLWVAASSYVKLIIPAAVVVFYWEHEISNWAQFWTYFFIESIMYVYFYAVLFIEYHDLASRKLKEIHERYDWSSVFGNVALRPDRVDFQGQARGAFFSIFILVAILQWFLIMHHQGQDRFDLGLAVGAVAIGGFSMIARIWYLSNHYFFGGLEYLFSVLDRFDPTEFRGLLPLHSSFVLARFERIFNAMITRLHTYERELAHWIFLRAEESRYSALGEISGLVVHDLSSPLHVMRFCIEQLKENPQLIHDERYLKQLQVNGDRAFELVSSLRAYLKSPKEMHGSCDVKEAYLYVLRLLETQFGTRGFYKIKLNVNEDLSGIVVRLRSADLIHILLNLMSNSVENLLANNIELAEITLAVDKVEAEFVTLSIRDNGTGLSKLRFEELTSHSYLPQLGKAAERSGLGLRLTRRLIERSGGTLTLESLGPNLGTLYHLRLALAIIPSEPETIQK